ncbi:MAG: hypothetical protein ACI9KK_002411 [Ascidiaceihabitans sp.]|jgi:hypothetical protein
MFDVALFDFGAARTVNFIIYAANIDLGDRFNVGTSDTNLVRLDGGTISTSQISDLSVGVGLDHSNFKFGLELPDEAEKAVFMVSSLSPGTEIRLCKSTDPNDLRGEPSQSILTIPADFAAYRIVAMTIPCSGAKYILFGEGNVESSIHSVSVY